MSLMNLPTDLKQLFIDDRPLIDVRAPVEFAQGAFPNTVNLPLLTDDERAAVGTCYKKKGQSAAIELGNRLVSREVRQQRIGAWTDFVRLHPDAVMYCFRGGLRSRTVQEWLAQEGVQVPRVAGGYKALRRLLIEIVEEAAQNHSFTILSGMTGVGKTELLPLIENGIDLEHHARHRGSAFGHLPEEQPRNIEFENRIGVEFLKKSEKGIRRWVVEDESRTIGANCLPESLYQAMRRSPLVVVEAGLDERAERIRHDYVVELRRQYRDALGDEEGDRAFCGYLQEALGKLRRRLGDQNWRMLDGVLQEALELQLRRGETDRHLEWITYLIENYYDPLYQKNFERRAPEILFQGPAQACVEFLKQP